MRFTSFIGIFISFGTIIAGILILSSNPGQYIDPPSILLTGVPTIAGILASCPFSVIKSIPSHMKALIAKEYKPEKYAIQLVELAKKARTDGLLTLEDAQYDDPFIKYGMTMVVDSMDKTFIENSLSSALSALEARHNEAIALYEKGAVYAPAFGMCATVLGLINMLGALDFSDATAINSLGANMGMALITTFYGSILANVLFLPIVARLKANHKNEMFCKELAANGILSILETPNPNTLYETYMRQLSAKGAKLLSASFNAKESSSGGDQ